MVSEPQRYWDFAFVEPDRALSAAEYEEELDRLFHQAVNRQLVSDVDVGAYLSGGMDSGSITALAAKQLPYIKSFTCGFDLNSASGVELGYDERGPAEYMSYLFKTEHYEMVLKAGDMERVLPRLAWHLEEPRVGQCYPNFYAAQLAGKFVKVVLSGAGGDELFAGYPWRYYRAVVNDDFEHYVDKYYAFWQRLLPGDSFEAVFRRCGTTCGTSRRATSSGACSIAMRPSSRAPRTTSTTRSTSRRRPSCTGCWSSRTSCRWRMRLKPGCRSSTTISSTSR